MMIAFAAMFLAWPPPGSSWKKVEAALSQIPAASGGSVLDKAKACHLRFRKSESWIAQGDATRVGPGSSATTTTLELYFDPPLFAALMNTDAELDQVARWTIRDGRAAAESSWAENLQNRIAPYGSETWMRCR